MLKKKKGKRKKNEYEQTEKNDLPGGVPNSKQRCDLMHPPLPAMDVSDATES